MKVTEDVALAIQILATMGGCNGIGHSEMERWYPDLALSTSLIFDAINCDDSNEIVKKRRRDQLIAAADSMVQKWNNRCSSIYLRASSFDPLTGRPLKAGPKNAGAHVPHVPAPATTGVVQPFFPGSIQNVLSAPPIGDAFVHQLASALVGARVLHPYVGQLFPFHSH